jgi:hypothetical protein
LRPFHPDRRPRGPFAEIKARDAYTESFAVDINDRGVIVGITR